jgi:glutathione S-transferase
MFKSITKISVLICLISVFNPVTAGRVDALYEVEMLVPDESSTTRERMFTQGLDEVFVRISGDSGVMKKLKRPSSSRYVKQFSYTPVENPEVNDEGELLTHRLNILYNGHAMEKYLLGSGFSAVDVNVGYGVMIARHFVPGDLLPALDGYFQRLVARDAFALAKARDGDTVIYRDAFYAPPEEG